jgi:hypothetical protein
MLFVSMNYRPAGRETDHDANGFSFVEVVLGLTFDSSEDPIDKPTSSASVTGFLVVEILSLLDDPAMNAMC